MKLLLVGKYTALQRSLQPLARSTALLNRVGPHGIEGLDPIVTLPLKIPDGHV